MVEFLRKMIFRSGDLNFKLTFPALDKIQEQSVLCQFVIWLMYKNASWVWKIIHFVFTHLPKEIQNNRFAKL